MYEHDMATAYLASTALMGVFVVAVLVWIGRVRGWYRYSPAVTSVGWSPGVDRGNSLDRLVTQPVVWILSFFLLVIGFAVGVVASISGPASTQSMAGMAVALGGGALLIGYLLYGVYFAAKQRGHPRSLAVAESMTVGGVLFLIAVTAQLLMA